MKHAFFNHEAAVIGDLAINANVPWIVGDNINFANNGAAIFGIGGAGAIDFNGAAGDNIVIGAEAFGAAKILHNGVIIIGGADPIIEGAMVTISNPETTSLALSHLELRDHHLQQICPHLSSNPNIEFIDFSVNQISETGLHFFINSPHDVISANFTACPIYITHPAVDRSIYQSPLIHCAVGDGINFLAQRQENATVIMNSLYKILNHFDLESAQERKNLIKFISSPTAQKALKWLSQNSEELGLKSVVGEEFVLLLNRLANEHMFYLKGVCKGFTEESLLAKLPPESLFNILSYLEFNDILPSVGPLGENVVVLGSSFVEEGDESL
jgi:hypothetical protein